jgi:hypothetical protein
MRGGGDEELPSHFMTTLNDLRRRVCEFVRMSARFCAQYVLCKEEKLIAGTVP